MGSHSLYSLTEVKASSLSWGKGGGWVYREPGHLSTLAQQPSSPRLPDSRSGKETLVTPLSKADTSTGTVYSEHRGGKTHRSTTESMVSSPGNGQEQEETDNSPWGVVTLGNASFSSQTREGQTFVLSGFTLHPSRPGGGRTGG